MLEAYDDIKKICDDVLMKIEVKDSGEARVAGLLLMTIAESYGVVGTLVRTVYGSHAPTHCRSMMESLVNLKLMVDRPGSHLDQIHFQNAHQSLKVVRAFAKDPDVAADANIMNALDAIQQEYQPTYDALKAKGYGEKKIFQLFKEAKLEALYISYGFYCTFTHNQLNTLAARHVGEMRFLYGQPLPDDVLEMVLGTSISLYGQALLLAPAFTSLTTAELSAMHGAVDARWAALKV
ncbi:DUF5677 domain-containing protein [Ralstonia mannitolilytica]|uniref:DUF5677 domain-containing protein n=1 Tax=Ralstonia mannitolilytica TaxID=105219 RepID=UPI00374A1CB0